MLGRQKSFKCKCVNKRVKVHHTRRPTIDSQSQSLNTVELICRYTSEKSTDKITVAFLTPSGGLIMLL